MSEYIASSNAVLRPDINLVVALNECNGRGVASALSDGGGTAGSAELECFLFAIAGRNQSVEILRFAKRRKRGVKIADVQTAWFANGMPAEFRADLIAGFEANRYRILLLRKRGNVGRPSSPFGSHVEDWLAIEKIMRRSRTTLTFDEAADEYLNRQRIRAGRGYVESERDLTSMERRLRRIKQAASNFEQWVQKIAN